MAKKSTAVKQSSVDKLNTEQALNHFKIIGRMRIVYEKKYKDVIKTENEWVKELNLKD